MFHFSVASLQSTHRLASPSLKPKSERSSSVFSLIGTTRQGERELLSSSSIGILGWLKGFLEKCLCFEATGMPLPKAMAQKIDIANALKLDPTTEQELTRKQQAFNTVLTNPQFQDSEILEALVSSLRLNDYFEISSKEADALRQMTVGLWGYLQSHLNPTVAVPKWTGFEEVSKLFQTTKSISLKAQILQEIVKFNKRFPQPVKEILTLAKGSSQPYAIQELAASVDQGAGNFEKRLTRFHLFLP